MGTITGTKIATRVRNLVNDTAGVRWLGAEMLDWVNDAQLEAVRLNPRLYALLHDCVLVAGSRQTLAGTGVTDGYAILDVQSNVSAAGVQGAAIRTVADRSALDAIDPLWLTRTGSAVVNAVRDPDPKAFYVYPALRTLGAKVRVLYGAVPPVTTALSDVLVLDDIYLPALTHYVAFRLYSKDAEFASNAAAASTYYQLFASHIKE